MCWCFECRMMYNQVKRQLMHARKWIEECLNTNFID
jgi:hypothetical protein